MTSVLIIEDDQRIRERVARALATAGFDVTTCGTALEGLQNAVEQHPDVVILDLGLPDIDGAEMLRMLRAVSDVPVVVATAIDDEPSIVALLEAGADDYVTKPFSQEHLEARIKAVLRRASPSDDRSEPIAVGELRIDPSGRSVTLGGRELDLSPKEFDLLRYLAEREGRVVSRRELLAEIWREPYGGADKTVSVHLSWLRKKLGESASAPRYLHTIHRVGVKLVDPSA